MILSTSSVFAQAGKITGVKWTRAAQLQRENGKVALGVAGAINAVTQDVLVVAGGANFPEKMPWEGGKKHYEDEIHILEHTASGYKWNKMNKTRLPEPIAYCGNTSTSYGVVYAGGENATGISKKAYVLIWDKVIRSVKVQLLPDLPVALTNIALTCIGDVVFALGGDGVSRSSSAMYSINLSEDSLQWNTLPAMPAALANAVVVAKKTGIYVMGGRSKNLGGISTLRSSTFYYDLATNSWGSLADISDGEAITNYSAGTGVSIGEEAILLTGGDNGFIFNQIEKYIVQIAQTEDTEEKAKFIQAKNSLSINHKGFYNGILMYEVSRNCWKKIGELPFAAPVTATATLWNGDIVLSSGEVKPGVRSPDIWIGKLQ